jgi:hypothetical protein
MSYVGKRRGSRKVLQTVRILFDGAGNAQISYDGGALGASTPCDSSTWLEIFNSTDMDETVNLINIGDDIGELIAVGSGGTDGAGNAAADELFISELGGPGYQYLRIDAGTRLSIKPVTTNPAANTQMIINFFD